MKKNRDVLRRVGRNIKGRCIGTTLLTKGLEFDVVIVLNAHLFTNPKHLYVALTRASKKLIVISQILFLILIKLVIWQKETTGTLLQNLWRN